MVIAIEVIFQTLLSFAAILIYARILGKQQIGQLTFFEYINGITFGSIAAVLATDIGTNKTVTHILGLTIFAALTFGMSYISLHSRPARKLISGEPTIVVQNGKILEQNMGKMRYDVDELLMQLREKNMFNIADVEYAILEPNGSLSVLPKSQKRTVTTADLQIPTVYEGVPSEIIVDGEIIYQNLKQNNLDEKWLEGQLNAHGVTDVGQVILASLDTGGKLYVDMRNDQLQNPTDVTDDPQAPQNG
ncbi:MAG: DUF421 domain-containing protein [Bacillota bacterium]